MRRLSAGLILLLLALGMLACSQQRPEGLSPQVEFLWRQHSNPHAEDAARRAASEARTLLADHDDDIELHFYYQDRLRDYEADSLAREYQRRLDRDPNDAVNIVLEAYLRKSGPYLTQVMPAALERDSTTAEVLAFSAIAMMGSRPPDSVRALELAQRATELHPGSYQAWIARSMVEKKFGNKETALDYAHTAADINPWHFEPVLMEAGLMDDLGAESQATKLIEDFHASQPSHAPSYRWLSRRYEQAQDWKKLYDLEMSISQWYPEDGYAFVYAANAARKLDDFGLVVAAYMKAAEFGFFDLEYATMDFTPDELDQFRANDGYDSMIAAFDAAHASARDQRVADAIDRPINIRLRNFKARDLDGNPVDLQQFHGKIVVLDFWATHERTHPITVDRLKQLRRQYPDVEVVSVSVLERHAPDKLLERVAKTAGEQGIDWPVWVGDEELANRMRISFLPVFAVVDADGYARYRVQGYHPYIDEILATMIDAAKEPVYTPDS